MFLIPVSTFLLLHSLISGYTQKSFGTPLAIGVTTYYRYLLTMIPLGCGEPKAVECFRKVLAGLRGAEEGAGGEDCPGP